MEIGKRWKALTASKKMTDKARLAKLVKNAAADKERYAKEMEERYAKEKEERYAKEKEKRDPDQSLYNAPKRGKSAYIFFCAEERPKIKEANPDWKATEVTYELGARWKKLVASKKKDDVARVAKLNKKASDDKARYLNEMEAY